jgi:TRAP-type C4-dicarboxylate transport system permease small subunit
MLAKQRFARAMEALYVVCIAISGVALVAITLMIPTGVFFRYALNFPLSWPEPASVIMMIMFAFLGGAAVFRANGHVAVEALKNAVGPGKRRVMEWLVVACMTATAAFMLAYGAHLCYITWPQSMAEFPGYPVGLSYMPIPIAGALTLLFIAERTWIGPPPPTSLVHRDGATELE